MIEPADVTLTAVTKRYGSVVAVDAINLTVPKGTYCCLLGPSGCGKTTTLRMIAGHERVSDGEIMLGRQTVDDLPPARLWQSNTAALGCQIRLHSSTEDFTLLLTEARFDDHPVSFGDRVTATWAVQDTDILSEV
jgi:ABC-type cobalamin/Fe3+-siderophores transport system ATPase subunit